MSTRRQVIAANFNIPSPAKAEFYPFSQVVYNQFWVLLIYKMKPL